MAEVKCSLCNCQYTYSFFEHWNCVECGADWGISLGRVSSEELKEVFDFYSLVKKSVKPSSASHTTVLAKVLESDDNPSASSYIDTLLLFFDSIVVPDLNNENAARLLGDKKFEAYSNAGIFFTSDNSFSHASAVGLLTPPDEISTKYPFKWDMQLADPKLESAAPSPMGNVRLSIYQSLENLEKHYFTQFVNNSSVIKLINENRIGQTDQIVIRGEKYIDTVLTHVVAKRFLRNEVFSYIYSYDLLTDNYYGIVNALRKSNPIYSRSEGDFEYQIFSRWYNSTALKQRTLDHNSLLEFRDKFGSLRPLIIDVKKSISGSSPTNAGEAIELTASEIEKRIDYCNQVFSKTYATKQLYLTGLLGTLGALVGGPVGAVVGGIGSSAISHLASEYDKNIPGPISWLATEFTKNPN